LPLFLSFRETNSSESRSTNKHRPNDWRVKLYRNLISRTDRICPAVWGLQISR
jgi:hypothetical protein